jgi:hypothetical protein
MTDDRMIKRSGYCVGSMYPHAIPLRTDKPLWLDGPFLLVDKDYVSHLF